MAVLHRTLRGILWAALALAAVALSLGVRRVDLWWQLPDGLSILATHQLPTAPTTAFGLPASPYLDEYSLYEIGLAVLDKLGGLGAIHAAFAAAFLLIFALPFAPAFRAPRDLVAAALAALALIFVVNRFEQRPEIIGVLLLVVLLRLLLKTPTMNRGFLLRLALLMAVWSHVHSSYLIGLLALALWLAQRAVDRELRWMLLACALTFGVAAASVLINPYGIGRVIFTFAQQGDPGSNLLSPEMWPAWDQPADVLPVMAVTGVVLVLALVARPRPPAWLGVLAVTLFLLTLGNIRHMSFLAAALLYLAAQRRVVEADLRTGALRTLLLGLSCVIAMLTDIAAVREAAAGLRAPALSDTERFGSALVATIPVDEAGAVLCHDAAGSYLTFARPNLHPYLDSGQGRFDDAAKRLYFFDIYDAAAFDQTLDRLTCLYAVLITAPVDVWALALRDRQGWFLAGCDDQGLLFQRSTHQQGIDESQRTILAGCRDRAAARGDFLHAFCFSALIDRPAQSLPLLDRSPADAWPERFYSFTREWLHRQQPAEVQRFLDAYPHPANPLVCELLLDRLPAAPLPPAGSTTLEQLARVVTLVDRGDTAAAAAVLQSMRKPLVSPLYYTLRGQLDAAAARQATTADRWQDWNNGGGALLDQTAPLLNARAETLIQSPAAR